ncbi:MAG TPA: NAD-glutamate dehydrogenase, partial [Patescibacteria group bacterium]|nr:NAD-glutamate dehydrogenase [Patescibacteria group bacterium]
MATHCDHLKDSLVEKVVALIRSRLAPAAQGSAERLWRAYYANVSPEDILRREPEALYGSVMALFAFARQRLPGSPKLRVYQPGPEQGGWDCEHSVIQLVNDDMPFLVDSLTAALQRLEIGLRLVVHPILTVLRDAEGGLLDILDGSAPGARLESVMHIEIERRPAAANALLAEQLTAVLADVRAAVEDWFPMRERLRDAFGELAVVPAGIEPAEAQEARDFLHWLFDDHFTLLGVREIDFDPADGRIHVDPSSGLGLLRDPGLRVFDEGRDLAAMPPEVGAFLRRPNLLLLAKADRVSTVHRPVPMDIV